MSSAQDKDAFDVRPMLNGDDVGALGLAFLSLAKELWIVKDRQMVLEHLLTEAGIDVEAKLEQFKPDAAFDDALTKERKAFIASVMEHLV